MAQAENIGERITRNEEQIKGLRREFSEFKSDIKEDKKMLLIKAGLLFTVISIISTIIQIFI